MQINKNPTISLGYAKKTAAVAINAQAMSEISAESR